MRPLAWYWTIIPRIVESLKARLKINNPRSLFQIWVDPRIKINIRKKNGAEFHLKGNLKVESFLGGSEPVSIFLGEKSKLIIDGDFSLGNGTQIFLDKGAILYIGGRRTESASGISERTKIMVRQKVHIGKDTIIAWGVFITDCDWHEIEGEQSQKDVYIGDHVWIASNASVLKGVKVGSDSIIGANSLLIDSEYPNAALIAGTPGRIVKNNISWKRDLNEAT